MEGNEKSSDDTKSFIYPTIKKNRKDSMKFINFGKKE